jgi:hypothetical protein
MGDGATVLDPVAKENKSFLDHSLPVLRSGCSVMRSTPIPAPCHLPSSMREQGSPPVSLARGYHPCEELWRVVRLDGVICERHGHDDFVVRPHFEVKVPARHFCLCELSGN